MQHRRRERIVLRDRKGFVRIAVEEGLDGGIVPVYHFGNTQVFDFFPQSLQKTSRKLRSALGFLVGRWGLPVPRRAELYMVSGPPVPVPKVARDSPEFDVRGWRPGPFLEGRRRAQRRGGGGKLRRRAALPPPSGWRAPPPKTS